MSIYASPWTTHGEAEMTIHARNDFLAVMNHEMRIPMHAIVALFITSLEDLSRSRLEDSSLELEMGK